MGLVDEARQHTKRTSTDCDVRTFIEDGGLEPGELQEAFDARLTNAAIARALAVRAENLREKIPSVKAPTAGTLQRHRAGECKRCG